MRLGKEKNLFLLLSSLSLFGTSLPEERERERKKARETLGVPEIFLSVVVFYSEIGINKRTGGRYRKRVDFYNEAN